MNRHIFRKKFYGIHHKKIFVHNFLLRSNATFNASANKLNDDVNFKHIIERAMSCTLEMVDKDVSYVNGLRFETINKVLHRANEASLEV